LGHRASGNRFTPFWSRLLGTTAPSLPTPTRNRLRSPLPSLDIVPGNIIVYGIAIPSYTALIIKRVVFITIIITRRGLWRNRGFLVDVRVQTSSPWSYCTANSDAMAAGLVRKYSRIYGTVVTTLTVTTKRIAGKLPRTFSHQGPCHRIKWPTNWCSAIRRCTDNQWRLSKTSFVDNE